MSETPASYILDGSLSSFPLPDCTNLVSFRSRPSSTPNGSACTGVRGANLQEMTMNQAVRRTHASTIQAENDVLAEAEAILRRRLERQGRIEKPVEAAYYLAMRFGQVQQEEFHVILLDSHHRILDIRMLFRGTIDGTAIHPRVVVQACLDLGAAAVIVSHNHPSSGCPSPSEMDVKLTAILKEALDLFDVRLLDHLIIGGPNVVSLCERGWK